MRAALLLGVLLVAPTLPGCVRGQGSRVPTSPPTAASVRAPASPAPLRTLGLPEAPARALWRAVVARDWARAEALAAGHDHPQFAAWEAGLLERRGADAGAAWTRARARPGEARVWPVAVEGVEQAAWRGDRLALLRERVDRRGESSMWLEIWDLALPTAWLRWEEGARGIAWLDDETLVVAGPKDIGVVSAASGAQLRRWPFEDGALWHFAAAGGRWVILADDAVASVWDAERGLLRRISLPTTLGEEIARDGTRTPVHNVPDALAIRADGGAFAIAGIQEGVWVVDASTGAITRMPPAPNLSNSDAGWPVALGFRGAGEVVSVYRDGGLARFDVAAASLTAFLPGACAPADYRRLARLGSAAELSADMLASCARPLSAAFSADGARLAIRGQIEPYGIDHLLVRDPLGGVTADLAAPLGRGVSLAPDGKRALFGHESGPVEVWELEPPRRLAALGEASLRPYNLAVSPEGRHVAVAGPHELAVWDTQGPRRRVQAALGPNASLAFSPAGDRLAASQALRGVSVYSLERDTEPVWLSRDREPLRGWCVSGRRPEPEVSDDPSASLALAFSSDGGDLLQLLAGGALLRWDVARRRSVKMKGSDDMWLERGTFVGDRLAGLAQGGDFGLWREDGAAIQARKEAYPGATSPHGGFGSALAASHDGARLAVLSQGRQQIFVLDPRTGDEIEVLAPPESGDVTALAWTLDGHALLAATTKRRIERYTSSTRAWQPLAETTTTAVALAVVGGGARVLAHESSEGTLQGGRGSRLIRIYALDSGQLVLELHAAGGGGFVACDAEDRCIGSDPDHGGPPVRTGGTPAQLLARSAHEPGDPSLLRRALGGP